MAMSTRIAAGALASLSAALTAALPVPVAAQTRSAELILTNGQVYAGRGWAEAVAVRSGNIAAVGSAASVRPLQGSGTRVIDLKGAVVVPGLHDMHVHPIGAGLTALRECSLQPGVTLDQVKNAVALCVSRKRPGEWIIGGPYFGATLGAAAASRQALDSVAPENPVLLRDFSGHTIWLNSKALQLAHVDRATPSPAGGVIERDDAGEPTGVLREAAMALPQQAIPQPTRAEFAAAAAWGTQQLLALGITSFTDAGVTKDYLQAYDDLADSGRLKQRVRACILLFPPDAKTPSTFDPVRDGPRYARDRVSPTCVKFVLDGVPLEGRTAAFIEPYLPAPGRPKEERGALLWANDLLFPAVERSDAANLTTKFHAVGDAAARQGLDAIEAARKANGSKGPRHEIAHSNWLQPADIVRARAIRATLEFSPALWSPSPVIDAIAAQLGPERMARAWPIREALDAGAWVVAGSDWPTTPSASVWPAIETLVTRQIPGDDRGTSVFAPRERITLKEAFDAYTIDAARQLGQDGKEGAIAPGMWADLVVLDRNPFTIPVTEINTLRVQMTLVSGEIVYSSAP